MDTRPLTPSPRKPALTSTDTTPPTYLLRNPGDATLGNSLSAALGNYVSENPSDLGNFMSADTLAPPRSHGRSLPSLNTSVTLRFEGTIGAPQA